MKSSNGDVLLERTRFVVGRAIPDYMIKDAIVLHTEHDFVGQQMLFKLVYEVASEHLDRTTVSFPKDWWQAFRKRWFPRWWLQRHPVEEKIVTVDVKALYPSISLPKQKYFLHISRFEDCGLG